mmetsp:Transcript_10724/g.17168  ORF Transcript_10724/g.17168 Transcript_10724/m.17168 type:complete len:96 (-) Transcript_10724:46-333(-)
MLHSSSSSSSTRASTAPVRVVRGWSHYFTSRKEMDPPLQTNKQTSTTTVNLLLLDVRIHHPYDCCPRRSECSIHYSPTSCRLFMSSSFLTPSHHS